LIGCGGRGYGAVKDCMEANDNIKIIAQQMLLKTALVNVGKS
jgi:hypothetical protein